MAKKKPPFKLYGIEHTTDLCPSCRAVAFGIRREMLQPVPVRDRAPLSHMKGMGYVCFDCAAAEGLRATMGTKSMSFLMARIATGNCRQEKLRLPGAPIGLPTVKNAEDGDLERLQDWQDEYVEEHLGERRKGGPVKKELPVSYAIQRRRARAATAKLSTSRRFVLDRAVDATGTSGTGVVAEGICFSNGKVALHWLSHLGAVNVYDSMDITEKLHGHGGNTKIVWIDK